MLERHDAPGGKMRAVPSTAGPVDAGPTVLTMRSVFDDLFAALGEHLDDHVTLIPQDVLARHFWPDGSQLDLYSNDGRNADAIQHFAGTRAADQFRRFQRRTRRLFDAFNDPVMRAAKPDLMQVTLRVATDPALLRAMAPLSTMAQHLARSFDDTRLRQLFGRYATYVGGSPYAAPALLSLIWDAEAAGVWVVQDGMHQLARALERLACDRGAVFQYGAHVDRIETDADGLCAICLSSGERIRTRRAIFNGDPRALATGQMGPDVEHVATQTLKSQRSHSAQVWAFSACPEGPKLAHHNVFFDADPKAEFDDLAAGRLPRSPSIYLCAQDRGTGAPVPAEERFELILNAPPCIGPTDQDKEYAECRTRTFQTLARFGLTFNTTPGPTALTTPTGFDALFPSSNGSLYGQSPHGMMAAFQRPTARTVVPGLYLAGGGTHPGAGVPMATLSARHAVAAIMQDQTSTSPSPQTVTPGGMSTGSATTAPRRSVSSGS